MPHISSGSFFPKLDPACCNTLICLLNFKSQTFSFAGERAAPLIYYIILLFILYICCRRARGTATPATSSTSPSMIAGSTASGWRNPVSGKKNLFFAFFILFFHLKWSGSQDKKARAGLKHKFHNSATFNVLFRQSSRQPKQDWIFIETSFNDLEGVFK